jgi:hypothetical protein
MKTLKLKTSALLLLLAFVPACGKQLVQFNEKNKSANPVAPTVTSNLPLDQAVDVSVNRQPSATFSQAMDPASINALTFTVKQGSSPIVGTVTFNGTTNTATFAPRAAFGLKKVYTATISTGVKSSTGVTMAAAHTWSFTSADSLEAPVIVVTSPASDAVNVSVNKSVTAIFSRTMEAATINDTTFTLKQGATAVAGTVTFVQATNTATFTPAAPLALNLAYVAQINNKVESTGGVSMQADYAWTFTTEMTPDTIAPKITATNPAHLGTNVPVGATIKVTFDEEMKLATMIPATFLLQEAGFPAALTVSVAYDVLNDVATLTPQAGLKDDTDYTVTVTTGAQDLAGNALTAGLAANPWTFKTEPGDQIAPTITFTNPASGATNVAINTSIQATFSEMMQPSMMNATNFTLKETFSNNMVTGSVSYDALNRIATFTPLSSLSPNTTYTAAITNVTDLSGNVLTVPVLGPIANPWNFTTAGTPPPLAVTLGAAASFGLASQEGLTSTGVTVIDGDVALYPLDTCTDATGAPGMASQSCLTRVYSSTTGMTVNGFIYYFGDPFDNGQTAQSVSTDLNAAWVEGKNKVDTMGPVAGDELGGKVFAPGVYHNAALGLMAGGVAVMDAQNDPNAVFIFKVDSSFVDSGTLLLPTEIVLSRGAQARNIWFIVGIDLTIGSGSKFNGNILAGRDATIKDGSTVTGRVLAGASGAGAISLTGAASPSVTRVIVPQ